MGCKNELARDLLFLTIKRSQPAAAPTKNAEAAPIKAAATQMMGCKNELARDLLFLTIKRSQPAAAPTKMQKQRRLRPQQHR